MFPSRFREFFILLQYRQNNTAAVGIHCSEMLTRRRWHVVPPQCLMSCFQFSFSVLQAPVLTHLRTVFTHMKLKHVSRHVRQFGSSVRTCTLLNDILTASMHSWLPCELFFIKSNLVVFFVNLFRFVSCVHIAYFCVISSASTMQTLCALRAFAFDCIGVSMLPR